MNHSMIMSVLQASSNLLYIDHNSSQWKVRTFRMQFSQRSIWSVGCDEKRNTTICDAKVEELYYVRMLQAKGAGFIDKCPEVMFFGQLYFQYFDCGQRFII